MTSLPRLSVARTVPSGPVTGPPVILLHGFAASGAEHWPAGRWADPLAAGGRETLVVDLPGHGTAPAVTSAADVTSERMLAYLGEVVQSAGAGEVDVVGYSLGGRLAWDLTAHSPVRRLVLGGLSPVEPFSAVDLAAVRDAVKGGLPPADPLTGAIAQMVTLPGRDTESLLLVVEGLAREPFAPAATPPGVPTLLIGGDSDPIQGVEQLAPFVPGGRVARVPGDHVGALAGAELRALTFDFLGVPG